MVSTKDIWAGFTRPATTTMVVDQAWGYVNTVAGLIGVDTFSRVGLRLQYLQPYPDTKAVAGAISARLFTPALLYIGPHLSSFEASLVVQPEDDVTVVVMVQVVHLADPSRSDAALPSEGVLFDADFGRAGTIRRLDVRPILKAAVVLVEPALARLAQHASD